MKYTVLSGIILFFHLFVSATFPVVSEELYFSKITVEDGLSESHVKTIIQDSYGFMWFGTKNGLNRYDGSRIAEFEVKDQMTGKGDQNVGALFEDDQRNLWVGTDEGIYIFDPVFERFTFFDQRTKDGIIPERWVSDIKKDRTGNIWIVIPAQGIFKYIPEKKELFCYQINPKKEETFNTPECLCITDSGKVWIGSKGSGLFLYDAVSDSFVQYITDRNNNSLKGKNVYALCEYKDGLAIGIHEGRLMKWNTENNILSDFDTPQVHNRIIRRLAYYDNTLYIATEAGLFVYDEKTGNPVNYNEDDLNPSGLSDNKVYSIYKDRDGGIWLGTLLGGVNYSTGGSLRFNKYVPLGSSGSLNTKKIRELCETDDGKIWIGTENGGVNIFDSKKNTFSQPSGLSGKETVLALLNDANRMLIGYFKKGMNVVGYPSFSIRHYSNNNNLDEESICALFKDSKGQYWLGTATGVFKSKDADLNFEPEERFGYIYVYDIAEDREQNIWVASIGSGVFRYDPNNGSYKHYLHDDKDPVSLSSNYVSSITVASDGTVWFSTDRGGICRYNEKTDNFTTYSRKDGLPDNVAYKILQDDRSNLWFGTNKGLVKFNPEKNEIRVFTKNDGLLGNQFSYKSALAGSDGNFYFGGIDGLISFDPHYKIKKRELSPVYITGMYIYNKEVKVGDKDAPSEKSILHTQEIKLRHDQSNISFDFAMLNYAASGSGMYAYKMDGIDRDWVYTKNRTASYSKLPPGKYVFSVKGADNDGVWNEKEARIHIQVYPPWWLSIYAYAAYILSVVLLGYYLLRRYNKKKERENSHARKVFEMQKEQELYSAKVDFFTSVAHEIKTPLSLIKGPMEAVSKMPIENEEVRKNLRVMELNTDRLLNLINQLLDFRKIDSDKLTLHYSVQNISELLQNTVYRFEPAILAENKEITLQIPEKELFAPVDKEALTKIVSNLLNNALKYSDKKIKVLLDKDVSTFSVHVISDGGPIPENMRNKIFKPFYQFKNEDGMTSGVGIGLSLASSLAELHAGSLKLRIDEEDNNDFTITLPLYRENIVTVEVPEPKTTNGTIVPENDPKLNDPTDRYTVLIVDDNEEILSFIFDRLSGQFNVITASDGQEAMDIVKRENIHVIISDVMMPVTDGLDLCRHIKENTEYSHIPVILLTAKNDPESKLKGLEAGADAYMEKPFSFTHLIAQVNNLLSNREKERRAFAERPFFPVYNMKMTPGDKEFMNKVTEEIQANIADENFNVERLSELLFMSRSALHRKIKNLVSMAPVDLIRLVRLKKAAELIRDGKYSMAEISVMVGINSPSYFSKLFQNQFGMTPKAFSLKHREEMLRSGKKDSFDHRI